MINGARGAALVTGAVGGIGTAIVKRFSAGGCPVVACDRREQVAREWLARYSAPERERISFYPLDVTREEQVAGLAKTLAERGVHVAYLINNAGINGVGEVWALESKVWERVLGVSLHGTFY